MGRLWGYSRGGEKVDVRDKADVWNRKRGCVVLCAKPGEDGASGGTGISGAVAGNQIHVRGNRGETEGASDQIHGDADDAAFARQDGAEGNVAGFAVAMCASGAGD